MGHLPRMWEMPWRRAPESAKVPCTELPFRARRRWNVPCSASELREPMRDLHRPERLRTSVVRVLLGLAWMVALLSAPDARAAGSSPVLSLVQADSFSSAAGEH